jgi:hypothetical protein
MEKLFDELKIYVGKYLAVYFVGLVIMVLGAAIDERVVNGLSVFGGVIIMCIGSFVFYRDQRKQLIKSKGALLVGLIFRIILGLLLALFLFIYAYDGQILTKYESIFASWNKPDAEDPPYEEPAAEPTSPPINTTTSPEESTSAPATIEIDKEQIRTVIEKFLNSWNNEIYLDDWDDHMTTAYRTRYIGEIYSNVDQLAAFFGDAYRRIGGNLSYDNWRNEATRVSVNTTILYGSDIPAKKCAYWFEMFKDTESGIWFIDGDKSEATSGPLKICP